MFFMKRQLYYLQCHHTSLLLNFYTKFPKLFETFKIFLKTFIKAILIKVCFIIENLPNRTDHKLFAYYQNTASIGFTNFKNHWTIRRWDDHPSYYIEDCRISKCIDLKLSIFFINLMKQFTLLSGLLIQVRVCHLVGWITGRRPGHRGLQ